MSHYTFEPSGSLLVSRRGGERTSKDESRVELYSLDRFIRMLDTADDHGGGRVGHTLDVVSDRGQINDRPSCLGQVIETNNREILGNMQPSPVCGVQCAVSDDIIATEQERGWRVNSQQLRCRRLSRGSVVGDTSHSLVTQNQPLGLE